jgi:hypothetical protein
VELPVSWQAEAFNQVPESENRIHSDAVARAYGFRGALVPGVVVSAYLIHPAVIAWGKEWLERGRAECVVHSPVYDGEAFDVEVTPDGAKRFDAVLSDPRRVRCATARVALAEAVPTPPVFRGDPVLDPKVERPVATRAVMEGLRERGLSALRARWDESAEITRYLKDPSQMPGIFREKHLASPAFVLALTNWILGNNARMSPWLHLQSESQNHRSISSGQDLVIEASIADLFEKKGHEFVDVDVGIFLEKTREAAAAVRLRAIYKMRAPASTHSAAVRTLQDDLP